MLNSGYEMPVLGIGCFMLSQQQAENSVYWALRDGYRLVFPETGYSAPVICLGFAYLHYSIVKSGCSNAPI